MKFKPLLTCANGDGRPVQPPSKVICRECLDKIGQTLRALVAEAKRRVVIECPCCGGEAALSDSDGLFFDGQALTCGCPGLVSVEETGEAWRRRITRGRWRPAPA